MLHRAPQAKVTHHSRKNLPYGCSQPPELLSAKNSVSLAQVNSTAGRCLVPLAL